MRGDILLYRNGGTPRDRIVCAYTRGPFCHCELDLGNGATVGAHSEDGISLRWDIPHERIVVISLQTLAAPERIEAGLTWALEQVGAPFSWASIADLALPPALSTRLFGRRSVYNCANLIARYLDITGGLDLPYGKRPPMIITPNDIARAAGLLTVRTPRGSATRAIAASPATDDG